MEQNTTCNLIMLSAMYENGGNTTHRLFDGHPELFVYPFESQLGTSQSTHFIQSLVPFRYCWPEFPLEGSAASDYELFYDEELKTLLRTAYRSKFKDAGIEMNETKRKESFVAFMEGKERTRKNLVEAFLHLPLKRGKITIKRDRRNSSSVTARSLVLMLKNIC